MGEFLDDIARHLRDESSPAEAVIEGVAYTCEEMHRRADLSLLLAASAGSALEITLRSDRRMRNA